MRAFARLLLLSGPGLSLPAVLGLWAHETLSGDLFTLASVAAGIVLETLLLWRRGLLREVTVLLLSGFWAVWAWLALTQADYDWRALPAWRMPDRGGQMIIILAVLVYLTLYEVADQRQRASEGS